MKIKWQWFSEGDRMFWMSIIIFVFLIISFITAFIIDPVTLVDVKVQKSMDTTSIKKISEEYVKDLRYNCRYTGCI